MSMHKGQSQEHLGKKQPETQCPMPGDCQSLSFLLYEIINSEEVREALRGLHTGLVLSIEGVGHRLDEASNRSYFT